MTELYIEKTKHCTALTCIGDYVISHWPTGFILSYRPSGQHVPLGQFDTLEQAKNVIFSREAGTDASNGGTNEAVPLRVKSSATRPQRPPATAQGEQP